MNASEKNPMLMMSTKTLEKKIADALAEGRRAGIEEALQVGSDLSLRDAKTLAESRARRDWRRENGKT